MIRNKPIQKKQLAAYFLLLVLLFIQGTKLSHTHDHDLSDNHTTKIELGSKSQQCDICDYHFAKDSFTTEPFIISQKISDSTQYFDFYQSRSVTSIGLSYSDRGPPSLI